VWKWTWTLSRSTTANFPRVSSILAVIFFFCYLRSHISRVLSRPQYPSQDLRFSYRWLWRVLSYGMQCRSHRYLLDTCFTLVSFLAYASTLKMEETYFSETPVNLQRSAWCHVPEHRTLRNILF
jgi:hypothetical protein